MKIIVAATEFCRCDLLHEFKISASSLVAAAVQTRRLDAAMCRSDLSHGVTNDDELESCRFKF